MDQKFHTQKSVGCEAAKGVHPSSSVVLANGELFDIDRNEERRLVWKLDRWLLPLMGFCYMLSFMDKTTLSQAALLGIREDLKLTGSKYTWCSITFYIGYLVWSWPTSYLIVRLPLGKYTALSVLAWGLILMAHALCQNFGGLMATRFLLGVGESAVSPGFTLIVASFYKRQEQPLRQGAWYLGSCIGNIIGGLVSYGIGTISGPLATWRYLYIILGAVTCAYSFLLLAVLPDSPAKAVFLNAHERELATHRTRVEHTTRDESTFSWRQVLDAVLDPQVWLLVVYSFCVNICNGGLTTFAGIIISGFGFNDLISLLLQTPLGGASLVFLLATSLAATYLKSMRVGMMIANCLVSLAGFLLIYLLPSGDKAGKLTGLCLTTAFIVNMPLVLSVVSANVIGATKQSTVSILVFAAFSLGNIVGPQFFFPSEEPRYKTGITACLSGTALGIFFLFSLIVYYVWENRRRDAVHGPSSPHNAPETAASTRTDRQIPEFRYVF